MSGVLRQSCSSYTRYLSPSPRSHSLHDSGKFSTAAPPASQRRSRSVVRNTLVRHLHQSRSSSFVTKRNINIKQAETSLVQNIQKNVSHWANLKKSAIDWSSFIQVISVLHIDLPKYFPAKTKALPAKEKLPMAVEEKQAKTSLDAVETLEESTTQNMENREVSAIPDRYIYGSQIIQREQHDLAQAMDAVSHGMDQQHNYFSSITFPQHESVKKNETASESSQKDDQEKPPKTKTGATSNLVKQITSYIPYMSSTSQVKPDSIAKEEAKKDILARQRSRAQSGIDRKTRELVKTFRAASRPTSQLVRLEEVCTHLIQNPNGKTIAVKENIIPTLLKLRKSEDVSLQERSREALALVGYAPPVLGRGIRILTLDGGGTRGLVSIEILKTFEKESGKKIHEMFDYVCGVSTGALLASLICIHKIPLEKVESIYKEFSIDVFARNKLFGVGKLFMTHAYYDTPVWENILRMNVGETTFMETARDSTCPKVSFVSSLMNSPRLENYMFRNYNLPPGVQSHYPGSCKYRLWEAIRASSAAPGYFEESKLGAWIHQDGGILTNNPSAIAIHECKLLWPNNFLQCVVSVGTGKYQPPPSEEAEAAYSSLKTKLAKLVASATDTEAIHTTLHDLLPPSTYFRFNPYMSEDFELDEIRAEKWDTMKINAQMYCRKNELKFKKAAEMMALGKLPHQVAMDWLKLQKDTYDNLPKSKI